ncbi:uncharacterized protein TNCV_973311 [Trichonephila clavipes]|nr:uncharacterized protein TNCV_973311 [Trichonephila clavipes]
MVYGGKRRTIHGRRSSHVASLIGLTEAVPGIFTIYLGAHLIKLSEELRGDMPESLSSKDGRISPFYYELEPSLVSQRALPPIPKDIGRIYDPVTMDKGYKWSSREPQHGCPYYDRSITIFDSWKEKIMIIGLCRCPPNTQLSCYREKCERRFVKPYYFLPLTEQLGFVSLTLLQTTHGINIC